MAEKLGLQKGGETAFMDTYLQRVRELPGHERFRTGISLRTSFKEPSDLPKSGSSQLARPGSSEDGFILFVSFPYFGGSSEGITLGPESESVRLLEFRHLGVDVPNRRAGVSEERDDIGEILVHQARYMLFDNSNLYAHAYS